ncbi:MAG: tRNA (adenosine(37)-N6)-dimethylallyltransferase MiaA [Lachnospiraceae bacterium]|nr:tRNA (adenosine(37)-N6)-dimethylallyltransferase MiaA [Lachnospiraceae bacterium]
MQPLIVLAGPTAVGKTALSIRLAQEIGGEIVSADSMQVYRHMDIGTAKVTPEEQQGIPHYLIDCCEPDEEFHVVEYQRAAREALQTIYSHGAIPIVTGGTGFYIQALVRDIDFTETGGDPAYRRGLEERAAADGGEALYTELTRLDPEAAASMHPHNIKRVIRALEYYYFTGEKISEHNRRERERRSPYNTLYLVINRERAELYRRIDQRVDLMLEQGLVEEVERLRQRGYSRHLVSMQGLGYKEIREALEGEISMEEAIYKLKRDTRHFAKRQLTWFRREPEAVWLNREDYAGEEEMLVQILLLCRERGILKKV